VDASASPAWISTPTPDLRSCPYSLALDHGIDPADWTEDVAVPLRIRDGRLFPAPAKAAS